MLRQTSPCSPSKSLLSSNNLQLGPTPASTLASIEVDRRNLVQGLGPCRSGCKELDEYVLLGGGFERGCIVGISAQDEDEIGVRLGLQVLVCSVLDGAVQRALVVTPRPFNSLLLPLRESIKTELEARGVLNTTEVPRKIRECLEKVMISCVFDMDGLYEVLADLDVHDSQEQSTNTGVCNTVSLVKEISLSRNSTSGPLSEIQDSQDEESSVFSSSPAKLSTNAENEQVKNEGAPPSNKTSIDNRKTPSSSTTPELILITHLSSLFTSLFSQRENSAAHATLRQFASRLRTISRTLPSNPLILLVNSTDTGTTSDSDSYHRNTKGNDPPPSFSSDSNRFAIDPTLRSIFNSGAVPSYVGNRGFELITSGMSVYKTRKPSFGLIFTQFLDLHLLCTRVPSYSANGPFHSVTVIEVLLDEMGFWEGRRGRRRNREQRWAAVVKDTHAIKGFVPTNKKRPDASVEN